MLEVRCENGDFLVYDTDANEPVVLFSTRAEADELIAALQIQELHARPACRVSISSPCRRQ